MRCTDAPQNAAFSLVARRNSSLSSSGRQLVFGFIFIVSIGIGATFAALGAWLVLPFAGAEMLVLYFAFRHIERHAGDYESITIVGDKVLLETRAVDRLERFELDRYWAQVVVGERTAGARLTLRSHGREVEIGRHLNDSQRLQLARTLRDQLHNPFAQFPLGEA